MDQRIKLPPGTEFLPTYIPCGVLAQVRILENLIAHKYLPARASYRATELPNTAWQATTRL